LQPHDEAELRAIIERAAKLEGIGKRLSEEAIQTLINLAGGDARVALGNLELAEKITKKEITQEVIESAAQQRIPNYDKNGEMHYDLISAFIKSMRAGDATATLYYLARMLQAGEDPKFIARRMIIFASEDIGLAGNGAMNLAVSCFLAIERIGLPEGEYTLYHCATTLAKAKKSRTIASAKFKAKELASEYPDAPVPLHLRNAPTKLMRDLNYQKGYRWEAGFHPQEGLLPDEIQGVSIFPSGE
jgi:putative ATPase